MIIQIVDNKVIDGEVEKYSRAAKIFVEDLLENTKCLSGFVCKNSSDNSVVSIVTHWDNEDDMNNKGVETIFLNNKANLKPYFIGNQTAFLRVL